MLAKRCNLPWLQPPNSAVKKLIVDVARQELRYLENEVLRQTFVASTSKFGLGVEEGSNCTPLGNFYICEKYGAHAPLNTIFKGRRACGIWSGDEQCGAEEDLILTRIFRLASNDSGLQNTYQRYIYFHGTNQESRLGTPASHGCVRLANKDIEALFTQIPVGTHVQIIND